jgi:tetratricopeptide (TPR) repeat protein
VKSSEILRSVIASQQGLGRTLEQAGRYEAALAAYREQLETVRDLTPASPVLEGVALHDIADVLAAQGEDDEAIRYYREALERKLEDPAAVSSSGDATTLQSMGRVLERGERFEEAREAYVDSLQSLETLSPRDYSAEGLVLQDLADVSRAEGDLDEAVEKYRAAVDRTRLGEDPLKVFPSLRALSRALKDTGDWDAAAEALLEGLRELQPLEPPNPVAEASALHELGVLRRMQGQFAEAVRHLGEAVSRKTSDPGVSADVIVDSLIEQAECELASGHPSAALELAEKGVEIFRQRGAAHSETLAAVLMVCGEAAEQERSREDSLKYFIEAAEVLGGLPDSDPLARGVVGTRIAGALEELEREEEAAKERATVREIVREKLASTSPEDVQEFSELCVVSIDNRDVDVAAGAVQRLWRSVEADQPDPTNLTISQVSRYLGGVLEGGLQDFDAALEAYHESLRRLRALPRPDLHAEGVVLHNIADAMSRKGQAEGAIDLYREAVEKKREGAAADTVGDFAATLLSLAAALADRSDTEEAGRLAEEALVLLRGGAPPPQRLLVSALGLVAAKEKQNGDVKRALELLEEAKGLSDSFEAYRLSSDWFFERLGDLYEQAGRRKEAESARAQATPSREGDSSAEED